MIILKGNNISSILLFFHIFIILILLLLFCFKQILTKVIDVFNKNVLMCDRSRRLNCHQIPLPSFKANPGSSTYDPSSSPHSRLIQPFTRRENHFEKEGMTKETSECWETGVILRD